MEYNNNWEVKGEAVYKGHSNTWVCTVIDKETKSPEQYIHSAKKEDAEFKGKLYAAAPDLLNALLAMEKLDTLNHLSNKWWKQAEICNQLRILALKKVIE